MDELFIEARVENLETLLGFISTRLEGCPAKLKNMVSIAAEEIFSNISRYAYYPSVGGVTVRIMVDSDITIIFEDSGKVFDPLSGNDPDVSLSADEREIGGLGVFMVRNIMDTAEYRREGDKNILTVRKKLA